MACLGWADVGCLKAFVLCVWMFQIRTWESHEMKVTTPSLNITSVSFSLCLFWKWFGGFEIDLCFDSVLIVFWWRWAEMCMKKVYSDIVWFCRWKCFFLKDCVLTAKRQILFDFILCCSSNCLMYMQVTICCSENQKFRLLHYMKKNGQPDGEHNTSRKVNYSVSRWRENSWRACCASMLVQNLLLCFCCVL